MTLDQEAMKTVYRYDILRIWGLSVQQTIVADSPL